jgi:hypothetical protein
MRTQSRSPRHFWLHGNHVFSEHQNGSRNYLYLQSALTPAEMGVSERRRRPSAAMAKGERNRRGMELPKGEPVLPVEHNRRVFASRLIVA